jgi:iron complex outermembrane receptor protein
MNISRLLTATALVSAGFAVPQAAFAQDTAAQADSGDEAETSDSEITVVGSRIRRNQFNGADPINLITRDEATAAGFNSTAEILQSTAITGGTDQINDTYGGFVVNGGPGVNTISLRGLGASRTLVLMNGRRIAPAGSRGSVGSADLNVLPNAMIDRIEVLNTGASSVYGSDAVAGVINIVTRQNINGITGEAQVSVPTMGNGTSYRLSLVGGFSTDNFRASASLEYFKRDAIKLGDLDWAQCPTQYLGTDGTNFGAGDYIDPTTGRPKCFSLNNGGVTVNTIGTPSITATAATARDPGVPSTYTGICNRWRPRAGATGTIPGYECVGGGTLSTDIRSTFDSDMLEQDVLSPVEIYTGYAEAAYQIEALGNAEFYTDVLVNRRKSSQAQHRQLTLDYPLGSPLIPVELRYSTAFLAPQAGTIPYSTGIRVFSSYGIYNNWQTVDFVRLNGGVRGELPFGWQYNAFIGKSWSDSDYTSEQILTDRYVNSFTTNAAGTACANPNFGCVAAPALTPAVVGGDARTVAPAWFDYITDPVTGHTSYRERTISLDINGPLFKLPGGMVQVALGIESRSASINDQPAPDSVRSNLFGFTSSTPTVGSDSVWEYYGEVELPLLSDQIIHNLTLNGSGRYTDYKSYGGQWTYKFGGILSPVKGVSFRGSYGTSYRAPALFEQFLGATSGFLANTNDPCHNYNSSSPALVQQRCAAEGLPGNGTFAQNSSLTVIGLGGAAAGLEAETSTALTFGGVLEPKFGEAFGNLSLAVDYFNVKIENGVSQLSAATVLSQCYNNIQRTTCDTGLITRTPYTGPGTGQLRVIQSYVNISDAKVEGIDFTLRYTREAFGGEFRLGAQATMFIDRYSRQLPTQAILDTVGFLENPKWTGTFDVGFRKDGWNFRYGVEWIDAMDANTYYATQGFSPLVYDWKTPDYFLHTASVRYDMKNYSFSFGIRNIFDTTPPQVSQGYTNFVAGNALLYSGFDMRGRTAFASVKAGF